MIDAKKILDDFLNSDIPGAGGTVKDRAGQAAQKAKENPLATGAIAAVLLGTGVGRAVTGSALRLGGLAAVAGLAYKAYQNYQSGNAPAETTSAEPEILPSPSDSPFNPEQAPQGESEFALVIVKAMIAAARADGVIDDEERAKIHDKLAMTGLDSDTQQFLEEEMANPSSIDDLVSHASTDAQKVELYTASRLAIDPDSRAEKGYLDMLAGRLQLPDALLDHIEATIAEATA